MKAPVAAVGAAILDDLAQVGSWVHLWRRVTRFIAQGRMSSEHCLRQLDQLGLGSVPMACMTVMFSAAVLAFYTIDQFKKFGFTDRLGSLIGTGVTRELGPVLTAIVVASREGSRITAELASMKVTEQIDALRALATDPVEYLVVPRYLGALIGLPMVTVVASVAGVLGGLAVAVLSRVPPEVYWDSVYAGVEPRFLVAGMVKALIFGALIALISCRHGLDTGHGAAAVGRATTAAVVVCVLVVHIADFGLALVFGG